MNLHLYLALFRESFRFAMQNIRANLLRTLLSLLGITIGVFCIIAILTAVDSLEYSIRSSISKFGDNVLFVQKWPWLFESDYPWWKYVNRPEVKYYDYQQLKKRLEDADAVSYNVFVSNEKVDAEKESAEGITLRAVTFEYQDVMPLSFMNGRYFTEAEAENGAPVALLGYDLAESLFGDPAKALDKDVRMLGRKVHVIGVMNKEGNSIGMGGDQDKNAVIPLNFVRAIGNFEGQQFNSTIMVKTAANMSTDDMEEETRGTFRTVRRLSPRQEDNFAINRITMLSSFLTKLFGQISLYGWVIAGFSILVGGFGIANIMFVSVKERTSIIGIQKALGAKRYFIMLQFLFESILLCLFGGLIGLVLVFLLSQLINIVSPLKFVLSLQNILLGVGISSLIGLLAGFIPSFQASRMDPIQAIRFNM